MYAVAIGELYRIGLYSTYVLMPDVSLGRLNNRSLIEIDSKTRANRDLEHNGCGRRSKYHSPSYMHGVCATNQWRIGKPY